jgi:hypothetical protein
VHARHLRAIPSLARAEPLKAATDKVFRHAGHVFLAIMSDAIIGRTIQLSGRAEARSNGSDRETIARPARSAARP